MSSPPLLPELPNFSPLSTQQSPLDDPNDNVTSLPSGAISAPNTTTTTNTNLETSARGPAITPPLTGRTSGYTFHAPAQSHTVPISISPTTLMPTLRPSPPPQPNLSPPANLPLQRSPLRTSVPLFPSSLSTSPPGKHSTTPPPHPPSYAQHRHSTPLSLSQSYSSRGSSPTSSPSHSPTNKHVVPHSGLVRREKSVEREKREKREKRRQSSISSTGSGSSGTGSGGTGTLFGFGFGGEEGSSTGDLNEGGTWTAPINIPASGSTGGYGGREDRAGAGGLRLSTTPLYPSPLAHAQTAMEEDEGDDEDEIAGMSGMGGLGATERRNLEMVVGSGRVGAARRRATLGMDHDQSHAVFSLQPRSSSLRTFNSIPALPTVESSPPPSNNALGLSSPDIPEVSTLLRPPSPKCQTQCSFPPLCRWE
ncbi:hypothetical protein BT69DRAFT_1014497 [Atractiella rhizophila]|nr:hypothetical protein BT69DRAFT_1014497 [Atractiella rhizophila]